MVTKSKLIQYLKDEGQYTLASEILINMLYDNLSKLKQINKLLKDEGLTVAGLTVAGLTGVGLEKRG